MEGPDQVPRGARAFVAAFLALMIASAVFVWEPWPFTSFRIFSELRTDEQQAWVIKAVDATGDEESLPLTGDLRRFAFQAREFAHAPPQRQDELCRVWFAAAPELLGRPVREVRLYQRTWRLSEREGDDARQGTVSLEYVCSEDGARDA